MAGVMAQTGGGMGDTLTARGMNDNKEPLDSGLAKKDGQRVASTGDPSKYLADKPNRAVVPPESTAVALSQVQADMIFLQCKQPKLTYSHYPGQQQEGFDFRKKPKDQGLSDGPGYYRAEERPGDHRTKKPNKLHVDLQAFTRATELIADKVYPDVPKPDSIVQFQEEILEQLKEQLCKPSGQARGQRPLTQSWEDDNTQRNNVEAVMTTMRPSLERVYMDFLARENPGLTIQNFMAFTDEFGILAELKLLTIQRTFALLADEHEFYVKDGKRHKIESSPKKYISFEPFCRSVVYLAVAAVDGPYEPHEKLLLIGHLMNATTGAVRLAHTRDLFPVEERVKQIQGPLFSTGEQLRWASVIGRDGNSKAR
jgi:hypothetical protein